MKKNLILNTDSYKCSHYKQYPPGSENVYSYIESRGGNHTDVVYFGLQMFLKEYLSIPITKEDILEAQDVTEGHGVPFNKEGWEYVLNKYNGYLPIEIKSIPEGTVLPSRNVLLTLENTDEKCFWLTNFIETSLLRAIWYPTTVATISFGIKKLIYNYLQKSSENPQEEIPFKLHDFGSRGVSSKESAGIGGLAHLINFKGTDTIESLLYARRYYNYKNAGYSIPASEHSTITSWGRDNEEKAFENMINQYGKTGKVLSVVSDSYDIYNAVDNLWGKKLKQKIIDSGATIVVRPDSGKPEKIIPEILSSLLRNFGGRINNKGYHCLPKCIRVIQGDGVNHNSIRVILNELDARKISGDNIAFGMGGALLQQLDRDTLQFAMKCSAIKINGAWNDVWKSPISDAGMFFKKASQRGRMKLIKNGNTYETVPIDVLGTDILKPVFKNGAFLLDEKFEDIIARANLKFDRG